MPHATTSSSILHLAFSFAAQTWFLYGTRSYRRQRYQDILSHQGLWFRVEETVLVHERCPFVRFSAKVSLFLYSAWRTHRLPCAGISHCIWCSQDLKGRAIQNTKRYVLFQFIDSKPYRLIINLSKEYQASSDAWVITENNLVVSCSGRTDMCLEIEVRLPFPTVLWNTFPYGTSVWHDVVRAGKRPCRRSETQHSAILPRKLWIEQKTCFDSDIRSDLSEASSRLVMSIQWSAKFGLKTAQIDKVEHKSR